MPSSWILTDLAVGSGAPDAGGNPYSQVISQNGQSTVQVVYNAVDNHIHELRLEPGQPWRQADLTAQSGAPDAVSNPFAYSDVSVFYCAQDFHIYELLHESGQPWKVVDLTAQSGAPNAVGGDPFVYNHFPGESMTTLVLYRAIDSHIHELSQGFEQPWKVADLTTLSGASNAVGDPFAYVTNIRSSRPTSRVIYHAADNHIHELRLEPGQPWKAADLTTDSGALNIVGDPTACVVWETTQDTARVFFHATDNHIHELRLGINISG
jgi:hypothetical protein